MASNKASLVIHPVRIRILQSLAEGPKTTQDISSLLPDLPVSSLYRHLKILLDGGMIVVDETRLVRGIEEKFYKISRSPHLSAEDVAGIGVDEHLRLFTIYVVTLLQGYSEYLEGASNLDFEEDRVGYSEVILWATNDQLDDFSQKLNEALLPLLNQEKGEGRHRHKFAVITHPMDNARLQDD